MLGPVMNPSLLWLPVLIAAPAAVLFGATWGVNTLVQRSARRLAARPHFTPAERNRLRALKARYRRESDHR
jgi:hypothetical protein